ncbi:MAG TPA: hypothetical protein VK162_26595 [Streptosporangiaceae bacterium]|nr:hypothetical protein [Streptosporangiaceae bacterium]
MASGPGWLPAGAAYDQAGPRPSWVALSQVALVAVTDACAVASSACHVARSDTASVLVSLAGTGRSNVFIGEDVEAELPEALQKVAADMGIPLADAERALSRIVTRIRVVPLQMGDYLNPAIAAIRRCDPELPRAARGDPDDLGTAAVAAFLAPAVIISKDSVFNRFGLALPADRWTEEAARMLVAAGYDAALEDAAHAAEVGARLLFGVIGAAKNAAVRNPKAAITTAVIAGLAAWYCHRRGWITGEHLRAAGGRIASAARPVAERIAAADARRNQARAALTVVQGHGSASLEERCARHLARRATAMTPAELSAVLAASGTTATAEGVRAVLASHPAFTPDAQDGFILGRPARVPVISSGARPLGAAVDGSLEGRDAGRAEPVTGQISTDGSPEHVNEVAWERLRFTSAGRLTSTGSPNPRSAQ